MLGGRKKGSEKDGGNMATVKKRNLFKELSEAVEDINLHRAGKITLRQYEVKEPAKLEVSADVIKDTREKLHLSRAVFAHELHISPRTLEKWEQGRGRPNDQAATLILLVRKYPDTIQRLKALEG